MNRASFLRRAAALLIAPTLLAKPALAAPLETKLVEPDVVEGFAMLRYSNEHGPLTPWVKVPWEQIDAARDRGIIRMRGPEIHLTAGQRVDLQIRT